MRLNLFMFFIILFSCKFSKAQNEKACLYYKEKLSLIDKKIKKNEVNYSELNNAISFLENITLIKSQSDGNYFGRFAPTIKDYENWLNWYEKNKNNLYWDEENNKVTLKAE